MPKRPLICLLLLALSLAGSVNAATNLQVSGGLRTRIMYTPEKLLTMGNALNIFSSISSTGGFEAVLRSSGTWEGTFRDLFSTAPVHNNGQWNTGGRGFPTNIFKISVKFRDTFYRGGPIVTGTIGDVAINYSPYTVRLDGSDSGRNPEKRGLALEGFAFDLLGIPTSLDTYYIWDSPQNKDKISFGGKANLGIFGSSVNLIYSRYLDMPTVTKSDGTAEYGQPKESEITYSIEVARNIGWDADFEGIYAQMQKDDNEPVGALNLTFNKRLTPQTKISFNYRDFEAGFDPRYRDKTRIIDTDTGYFLGWNPVDRYANQLGYGVNLESKQNNGLVKFGLDAAEDRQSGENLNTLTFGGELQFGNYLFSTDFKQRRISYTDEASGLTEDYTRYRKIAFGISRELTFGDQPYTLSYDWVKRDPDSYWDNRSLTHSLEVTRNLEDGKWKGMTLSAGVRKQSLPSNSKLYLFAGMDYKTPGGLQVKFRFTNPNLSPPSQSQIHLPTKIGWYDEFLEERYDYANVFLVSLNSSF